MTPLPRWVFLALLLAGASAALEDDACVLLCRAQNRGLEIAGACDHQQRQALQSGGGRFPLQRLLELCLTPCSGSSGSPNDRLFDGSEICRFFRQTLICRRACSCELVEDDWTRTFGQDAEVERFLEDLEYNELKLQYLYSLRMPGTWTIGEPAVASDDVGKEQGLSREFSEDEMKLAESDEVEPEEEAEEEGEEASVVAEIGNAPVQDSTEESTVDWDTWCITQCDSGQGGAACNCDIIP